MKITAIHFRKLSAVTEMKMRTLMSKKLYHHADLFPRIYFSYENTVPIHR